jgi:hypothetical protein
VDADYTQDVDDTLDHGAAVDTNYLYAGIDNGSRSTITAIHVPGAVSAPALSDVEAVIARSSAPESAPKKERSFFNLLKGKKSKPKTKTQEGKRARSKCSRSLRRRRAWGVSSTTARLCVV